jgi:hypothetical protein
MPTSTATRVAAFPTAPASRTKAARFVNRDHHVGYVAGAGSGTPTAGGTFYARCPACGVTLALTARGLLPRHKAAAHG